MLNHDNKENLIVDNTILSCLSLKATNKVSNVLDFLNNLVISDLKTFHQKELQFSAFCNPKGRIISTFWIYINDAFDIKILCPTNMVENLITFFNARKFRLKINISLATDTVVIHSKNDSLRLMNSEINSGTNRLTHVKQNGFYLFLIKQKLVWIDQYNTEKFIPQHVNLDLHAKVMSFSKGCYPGQEIIARIKYLGKIKKRMVTFQNHDKNKLINETDALEKVSPIIQNNVNKIYIIQAIKPCI